MKNKKEKQENNVEFNLDNFQFLGDNVLVKEVKSSGVNGLIKPKQADDKPEFGIVVSVGEHAAESIKEGDIVMFGKYTTEETRHNGEKYFFVHLEDIKGVLKR
jgi:chaperonin GroES